MGEIATKIRKSGDSGNYIRQIHTCVIQYYPAENTNINMPYGSGQ